MLKYPKAARILTRRHFIYLSREGKRVAGTHVVFEYRRGKSSLPKLGITVLKKHGKAHDRNRFKRVTREAFRQLRSHFPSDLEINVMSKFPLTWPTKDKIINDFLLLLDKIKSEESQHHEHE